MAKEVTLASEISKLRELNMLMRLYSSIYYISPLGLVTCKSLLDGIEYAGVITNTDLLLYSNSVILPNKLADGIRDCKVKNTNAKRDKEKISIYIDTNLTAEIPLIPNDQRDFKEFYKMFPIFFDDLRNMKFTQFPDEIAEDLTASKLVEYQNDDTYLRMTRQLFPGIKKDSKIYFHRITDDEFSNEDKENPRVYYIFKLCLKNIDMYTLCATIFNK